jgi:hypothetical protein
MSALGPARVRTEYGLSLPSPLPDASINAVLSRISYSEELSCSWFFRHVEAKHHLPADYIFFEGMTPAAIVFVLLPLIA